MSALFKTKTTFRSKFSALGALLLVLNFGVVWGQTQINMTSENGTTNMTCGTTSGNGNNATYTNGMSYKLTLTRTNASASRKQTFNFPTGVNDGIINIESFTFYAVMAKTEVQTRTRTRTCTRTGMWGGWTCDDYDAYTEYSEPSYEYSFNYLNIGTIAYANSKDFFTESDIIGTPNTTTTEDETYVSAGYNTRTYTETQTKTTTTYYLKQITIPASCLKSSFAIEFVRNTNYTYPNTNSYTNIFQANVSYTCCPTITQPATTSFTEADETIILGWNSYQGASSYKVILDGIVKENAWTATTYTLNTSALSSGLHTWQVVPNNLNEDNLCKPCSTYSFTLCKQGDVIPCVDPNSMTPSGGAEVTSRWLSWDPVPCATGYNLYYSTDRNTLISDANKKVISGGDNTEYLLPLMPEGEYFWTVIPTSNNLISPTSCGVNSIKSFKIRYLSTETPNVNVLPSTQGQEFYFSLMENGYYTFTLSCDGEIHEYSAIIAPSQDGQVTFHRFAREGTGDPVDTIINVFAGTTATIPLKESDIYHNSIDGTNTNYKNRTIRVTCDFDISLYIANEACNSFDASIVLPTSALGAEYMIQSYPNGDHAGDQGVTSDNPCFMVIATEDNTKVRITGPSTRITALRPQPTNVTGPNNGISYYEIELNEGESYFARTDSYSVNDLSGLKISVIPDPSRPRDNCKTIAVFNGNTLTRIPDGNSNLDHIFEQAYPISNWGKKFAITSSAGYQNEVATALNVDRIRITAVKDDTEIKINGSVVDANGNTTTGDLLSAGGTYEFDLSLTAGSCYIETSEPVACYLYQRSAGSPNNGIGDPSMVWVSPIELGIEELTFSTFAANGIEPENHYVNIVLPVEAINAGQAVTLTPPPYGATDGNIRKYFFVNNNENNSLNYVANSGDKYVYARVQIEHGTYTLRSNGGGKMVIHVYGLGSVRGYAYNAGSAAIPYRSNLMVGTNNQNGTNYVLDVSALPNDHHFCSGTDYRFSVNSNATNVDHIDVYFRYDNGIGSVERESINVAAGETHFVKNIDHIGEHIIEAHIFSIVYNNELCQETMVEDIIEDRVIAFAPQNRTVIDSVCKGTVYKFTESYYTYDTDGELQGPHTYAYPPTGMTVTESTNFEADGFSKYGCPIKIYFNLTVYDDLEAGNIEKKKVTCSNQGASVSLEITKLLSVNPASGGDPDAHYQWQFHAGVEGNEPAEGSTGWNSLDNQTESHTVAANGWYRRAYISECGIVYTDAIYATEGGDFNPGTHTDASITVCGNETVNNTTIGACPSNVTGTAGNYTWQYNETTSYPIGFIWQESSDNINWSPIDVNNDGTPDEVGCQYTVSGTFPSNRYFRRLITEVGGCQLNLDMGVFAVLVKPTFNYTYKIFNGCTGTNGSSAKIQFTITDGSGKYKVYYTSTPTDTAVNIGGGVYEFPIPVNTGSTNVIYNITIEDKIYECKKEETVTVNPVESLSLTYFGSVEGCQGTEVKIPIPTISGGTSPYTLELAGDGVGIIGNVVVQQGATYYSTTIPTEATPGARTVNYKVTDASGCYIGPISKSTVTVYANPKLKHTPKNIDNCGSPNGKIDVNIENSNQTIPNYTFSMTSSSSTTPTTITQDGSSYTYQNLSQGTYSIEVKDGHECKASVGSIIIEDYLDIEIGLEVKNGSAIVQGTNDYYKCCPKSSITLTVTSLKEKKSPYTDLKLTDYSYSFENETFASSSTTTITMPDHCGDVEISVRVQNNTTKCIEEKIIVMDVRDESAPTIAGTLNNMDVTTYFCPTYTVPEVEDIKNNIKDYIHDNCVSDDDLSDLSVSVTPNTGTFNVADGPQTVTITVKDLCGNPATKPITITPKPWPNFYIQGDADGENNCYCDGSTIELVAKKMNGETQTNNDFIYNSGESYKWEYKNGEDDEYVDVTDLRWTVNKHTLTITSADKTVDEGWYRLTITKNGCSRSAEIKICVHPAIEFNLE